MGFFKVGAVNISNTANGRKFTTNQLGSRFGYGKTFNVIPESQYSIQIGCIYQGDIHIHVNNVIYPYISNLVVSVMDSEITVSVQIHDAKDGDYLILTNICVVCIDYSVKSIDKGDNVKNIDRDGKGQSPSESKPPIKQQLMAPTRVHAHLLRNLDVIHRAKTCVESFDPHYFELTIFNDRPDIDISIVMTTYNRSKQTYFTLTTIAKSAFKKVQVIIVDNSTTDKLNLDRLTAMNLCIYHVIVKNKFWANPCVNYNAGFKLIKGSKIIIQNAEVCHIGDVVDYVNLNLQDNQYFVFDVPTLKNASINSRLHEMDTGIENYANISKLFAGWYQHGKHNNRCFHFLTAITALTFRQMDGCFDYDFCAGSSYDDDEFIFRIRALEIHVINVPSSGKNAVMGVHQWHVVSGRDWDKGLVSNKELLDLKKNYFLKHKRLFYATAFDHTDHSSLIQPLNE